MRFLGFGEKKTMEKCMQMIRELPTPQALKQQFPLDPSVAPIKEKRDAEIADIFSGKSDKFLLIIGPCSADNEEAVLDYMNRLARVYQKIKDKIFIIPRVYTNKPRTTGLGYKGMLHQPNPEGKEDMLAGIIAIREMHARVVRETGFTCAEEMLYPENHSYLSDLLSYVAVGARSVEDQQHRMVASGIGIPAGMKNPTSGDISVMMNSIIAAQNAQKFVYRGWEVKTTGNPYAHAILRGYVNQFGQSIANYHYEDLRRLLDAYEAHPELVNPSVIIDTNHSNSGKKFMEQIRISKDVMHSRHVNPDIRHLVKGLMIESYIEDGAQKIGEGIYGKSITDPCLGWEKTEKLLLDLAELV
jgi:3-deoxy-7-phosphoheptulonate synthase